MSTGQVPRFRRDEERSGDYSGLVLKSVQVLVLAITYCFHGSGGTDWRGFELQTPLEYVVSPSS